jgi:hypothetical protein
MKNSDLIFDFLDISRQVPLTEKEMAESLTVTFRPPHKSSETLNRFAHILKTSLSDIGVEVISYDEALLDHEDEKIKPGVIIIEQGECSNDNLAMTKVTSLYKNPIVAIFDSPPPIPDQPTLQQTLDSIVGVLAWNLTHVPIFVENDHWTFCTMNGSVVKCGSWQNPTKDILESLIPKLAAQVVPPKRDEIRYRENKLNSVREQYGDHVEDFMRAATIWRDNGLMLAHTSVDDLKYRNRLHKRLVSQYLDNRTGMSYGFMVKQLPVDAKPAIPLDEAPAELKNHDWQNTPLVSNGGLHYAVIRHGQNNWLIEIPDVWLLSTRSGCNKTDLNPEKDLLRLGLHKGKITIDTPPESSAQECRPSYDTYAILAHALGNVITASLLLNKSDTSLFADVLRHKGFSISHWHGYPDKEYPLPGYVIHGEENPPVSCSTPQSAAYAFRGKLKSLSLYNGDFKKFRGDIHIEPHHGTNISGCMNLTETASWVDEMHKQQLTAGQMP